MSLLLKDIPGEQSWVGEAVTVEAGFASQEVRVVHSVDVRRCYWKTLGRKMLIVTRSPCTEVQLLIQCKILTLFVSSPPPCPFRRPRYHWLSSRCCLPRFVLYCLCSLPRFSHPYQSYILSGALRIRRDTLSSCQGSADLECREEGLEWEWEGPVVV